MRGEKGKAKKREERQPTDGSKRMKRSRIEKSSSIGSTMCVLILTRDTEWSRKDRNIKGKSCQDQMQNKPFAFLFAARDGGCKQALGSTTRVLHNRLCFSCNRLFAMEKTAGSGFAALFLLGSTARLAPTTRVRAGLLVHVLVLVDPIKAGLDPPQP